MLPAEAAAIVAQVVADGLAAEVKASKPEDYDVLRADYVDRLFDNFIGYASSGGSVTKWRNAAGRAVLEVVAGAIEGAFAEADAEMESDDTAWLRETQTAQVGHLPGVFDWLKEQRDAETITEDAVQARAEQWAQALDGIRSEAQLRTKGKEMLTWHVGDTEHCDTCRRLDGKRHSAKWYIANDYIPGKAGAAMDCGGYRCQCWLEDKNGDEVTL